MAVYSDGECVAANDYAVEVVGFRKDVVREATETVVSGNTSIRPMTVGNRPVAEVTETETLLAEEDYTKPAECSYFKPKHFENTPYDIKLKWKNIFLYTYVHLLLIYGWSHHLTGAKWSSILFAFFYGIFGGLGISAASHRHYSHRSYKATKPLQVILLICHCIANQNDIRKWVRDHRSHHKFNETDADPHNSKRGMFFAHIGWLLVNKHPEVTKKGKTIDMSDIDNDPLAMFQTRYFFLLGPFFCFVLPTFILWYFFGESLSTSWFTTVLRFAATSNFTWLINSASHSLGMKPFDRHQSATDNMGLKYATLGEGYHNYHHSFAWDYSSAELGNNFFSLTTRFIDFFAMIGGWAYDRRVVPLELVRRRVLKTGDGSHRFTKQQYEQKHLWGWGDKDMLESDMKLADIYKK